jgi:hypothetical protein
MHTRHCSEYHKGRDSSKHLCREAWGRDWSEGDYEDRN